MSSLQSKNFCLDCKSYKTLDSSCYTKEQKKEILKTYKEGLFKMFKMNFMMLHQKQLLNELKNRFLTDFPKEVLAYPMEMTY